VRAEFEAFYHATYGRLTAQLHAYLGDRAEAEDLVQDAFARTWQRWTRVSRYEDPTAFVRRVAWNLAANRWRRLAAAARALRRHGGDGHVRELDPDHVALVAALRKLPERQRSAIVLHYLVDLPVAEVAAQMGAPRGTVVAWLHRGRRALAGQLTDPAAGWVDGDGDGTSTERSRP
jgi:RNA polymerase sigma-70 factor (ECF subfamily)